MDYPKRKRLRLPDYDYSSEGVYFLTLCTKDRAPILSNIKTANENGETVAAISLTHLGGIVQEYILSIPKAYPYINVDSYVIMPDHVHLLLRITSVPARRAESSRPTASVIAQTVAVFKRLTSRDCKQALWQDGYYDHIIRDAQDYQTRIEYIETNPLRKILNKE
ncbi:MAG: transposase [Faecousia sp.]